MNGTTFSPAAALVNAESSLSSTIGKVTELVNQVGHGQLAAALAELANAADGAKSRLEAAQIYLRAQVTDVVNSMLSLDSAITAGLTMPEQTERIPGPVDVQSLPAPVATEQVSPEQPEGEVTESPEVDRILDQIEASLTEATTVVDKVEREVIDTPVAGPESPPQATATAGKANGGGKKGKGSKVPKEGGNGHTPKTAPSRRASRAR